MRPVATDKAPKAAGPYSQAVIHDGIVYVSGQLPKDPCTGTIPEGIEEQAEQVFRNISGILSAAGSDMGKVLKVTVYMSDISQFAAVNSVYARWFSEPFPARSCVEVSAIPQGASLEVDAVAFAGSRSSD